MNLHSETTALVALLRTGKRGWAHYAELVDEAGSAVAVLERELAGGAEAPTLFEDEEERPDLEAISAEISSWQAEGMSLLTMLHPEYPENLRSVHDRPPFVFVAGHLEPRDARSVAIVGTRRATDRGLKTARATAAHLVDCDYTVVSGLAAGIDAAAHTSALERGGRTVAVIGTGLRKSYPPTNANLQREISERCAVLSQFWPDSPPSRRSFPMRNAVMSGFALATVVVEASQTSGARMQARLALGHARPVFLYAPLLEHDWARDFAERPGVHVVTQPEEVSQVVEQLTAPGTLVA